MPARQNRKIVSLGDITLYRMDCLELLAQLEDNSIDLIATDPPYYKVKSDDWDRQWPTKQAFFDWMDKVLVELSRVLRPTGSLYLFAGPYLAAETEIIIGRHFDVLNHIAWLKPTGRHLGCRKESLTKYFPQTERILFAQSKKKRPFPYESIFRHIHKAVKAAGIGNLAIDSATRTQMSGHWLQRSQFSLPSETHYNTLISLGAKLKPYGRIKRQYNNARKGRNRRYFHVTKAVPYTDVWTFPVVKPYKGKHPCEKPLALMEHIINASSKPGDVILDVFTGSGTTAISAQHTGRKFIGSEKGKAEFELALKRIKTHFKAGENRPS